MTAIDTSGLGTAGGKGCLVTVVSDSWPHAAAFISALADEPGFIGVRIPVARETVRSHIDRFRPSILLLHYDLWAELAADHTGENRNAGMTMRIIVVDDANHSRIKDLICQGCAGVIPPDASADLALRAVKAVARGETWASRQALADAVRALVAVGRRSGLTKREDEVLDLVIEGKKNSEIAEALFISRETVRWHLRRIYAKRGIHRRKDVHRTSASRSQSA